MAGGLAAWFAREATLDAATEELRRTLGVEHAWLVSSGRAALTLILRALAELSGRSRVIIPAYTCYSVPAAIVRAGLDIVPCDIDAATLDFAYEELEARLSEAPALCVVSTHLFGLPADVERARRLVRGARCGRWWRMPRRHLASNAGSGGWARWATSASSASGAARP